MYVILLTVFKINKLKQVIKLDCGCSIFFTFNFIHAFVGYIMLYICTAVIYFFSLSKYNRQWQLVWKYKNINKSVSIKNCWARSRFFLTFIFANITWKKDATNLSRWNYWMIFFLAWCFDFTRSYAQYGIHRKIYNKKESIYDLYSYSICCRHTFVNK